MAPEVKKEMPNFFLMQGCLRPVHNGLQPSVFISSSYEWHEFFFLTF